MGRLGPIASCAGALYYSVLFSSGAAAAEQWQPSLASTASLRTGGATLVSSDALEMAETGGNLALVTYWEARTPGNLDVYRCIDVVDSAFHEISQQCWRALRPTGDAAAVNEGVVSSLDICAKPDDLGGIREAAYCAFTRASVIRTPYFALMIEPLDNEGLVSVSDEGHSLSVTGTPWPSPVFFEVRVTDRRDRSPFVDTRTTRDIPGLADDEMHCELVTVSNREWAACRSSNAPNVTTRYLIRDDLLYEVSFNEDVSAEAHLRLDRMLSTLDPSPAED